MDKHPWHFAIQLLQVEAQKWYRHYEDQTKRGNHDSAKQFYDQYVELNTAKQFLVEHKPSGCLEPTRDMVGIATV